MTTVTKEDHGRWMARLAQAAGECVAEGKMKPIESHPLQSELDWLLHPVHGAARQEALRMVIEGMAGIFEAKAHYAKRCTMPYSHTIGKRLDPQGDDNG